MALVASIFLLSAFGTAIADEAKPEKNYAALCYKAANKSLGTDEVGLHEDLRQRSRAAARRYCGCIISRIKADRSLSAEDRNSIFQLKDEQSDDGLTKRARMGRAKAVIACQPDLMKAASAIADEFQRRRKSGKAK